jgi:hypothetical protein
LIIIVPYNSEEKGIISTKNEKLLQISSLLTARADLPPGGYML